MLRTSSFFGPLNSGFVPLSSAAPVDALADQEAARASDLAEVDAGHAPASDPGDAAAEAAEVVARAAALPAAERVPHAVAPWAPASSARIRVVEGAVLAALCAYFGWGLLSALVGY
ncbi:MAG: hypothetical protein ACXWUL_11305 [Caldimonas sp.]